MRVLSLGSKVLPRACITQGLTSSLVYFVVVADRTDAKHLAVFYIYHTGIRARASSTPADIANDGPLLASLGTLLTAQYHFPFVITARCASTGILT
jgi:hypothetical protein